MKKIIGWILIVIIGAFIVYCSYLCISHETGSDFFFTPLGVFSCFCAGAVFVSGIVGIINLIIWLLK